MRAIDITKENLLAAMMEADRCSYDESTDEDEHYQVILEDGALVVRHSEYAGNYRRVWSTQEGCRDFAEKADEILADMAERK